LNNWGQLGIGNRENCWLPTEVEFFNDNPVIQVTGGDHHTIFLTEKKEVFGCGKNDEGQCGIENKPNEEDNKENFYYDTPQKVEFVYNRITQTNNIENNTANLNADDSVIINNGDGYNQIQETTKTVQINNIYSNMNFNYAKISGDNHIFSWGWGESYVLGNKREKNELKPYNIPSQFFYNLTVNQVCSYFFNC
jgi:alpha-tubulin suppressor-like RCC1 family protein